MIVEINMAAEQQRKNGLPVRENPPESVEDTHAEVTSRRRLMRVETNDLMAEFRSGDVVGFSIRVGRLAFVTAGTCAQFGCPPGFEHYMEGVTGLVEDAEREIDKALSLRDWHGVRVAAAKLECVWYGAAANLGLPYGAVIKHLHDTYLAGGDVSRDAVREILRSAGMEVGEDAPANDQSPTEASKPSLVMVPNIERKPIEIEESLRCLWPACICKGTKSDPCAGDKNLARRQIDRAPR